MCPQRHPPVGAGDPQNFGGTPSPTQVPWPLAGSLPHAPRCRCEARRLAGAGKSWGGLGAFSPVLTFWDAAAEALNLPHTGYGEMPTIVRIVI